jgi:K+-sensing histidine kinase KdpD
MGLAIAKGIVEAHGGRIRIEDNTAGRGSRFVVTLPIGDEDETALDSSKESDVGGNGRQTKHPYL